MPSAWHFTKLKIIVQDRDQKENQFFRTAQSSACVSQTQMSLYLS